MDTFHILNFHQIFAENASCLSQRLGIDIIGDFEPQSGHTYIIFSSHDQAAALYNIQQNNQDIKYIIINTEPPQSNHHRNKYYISLMKNNIVCDYHPISSIYLKSLGIRVFCQYNFEFFEGASPLVRDIDILFVGTKSDRREAIYKRLKERYPDKNIVFEMDWKHSDPNRLNELLWRAKTVLNIPFYDSNILETHRINKALSCGCEVVSLFSGHKHTDDFYSKYIYMVDDLFQHFDEPELPLHMQEKKLGYADLVRNDISKCAVHLSWILTQLSKSVS